MNDYILLFRQTSRDDFMDAQKTTDYTTQRRQTDLIINSLLQASSCRYRKMTRPTAQLYYIWSYISKPHMQQRLLFSLQKISTGSYELQTCQAATRWQHLMTGRAKTLDVFPFVLLLYVIFTALQVEYERVKADKLMERGQRADDLF